MKVTITLRGVLKKKFFDEDRVLSLPDGTTCEDALLAAGIDWRNTKNFGFVAINSQRVMITDELHDGDELKAYSKISGG